MMCVSSSLFVSVFPIVRHPYLRISKAFHTSRLCVRMILLTQYSNYLLIMRTTSRLCTVTG
jgi:hypothetical protein